MRILIATDNISWDVAMAYNLEKNDYEVVRSKGQEVLIRAQTEPFDLIFLGCYMDDLEASQVLKQIRQIGAFSAKIVVVTLVCGCEHLKDTFEEFMVDGFVSAMDSTKDIVGIANVLLQPV